MARQAQKFQRTPQSVIMPEVRSASLVLPENPPARRTDNWLLDLPTEIRQSIYRYLFCENKVPIIWIARHYKLWPTLQLSEADPVFQTQTFRLCKTVHDDAVRFAYGFNDFEVRDDFGPFCRLGKTALAAVRNLTVVQGAWRAETSLEARAWELIQDQCLGLENLEVVLHADMLIPAISFLEDLEFQDKDGAGPRIAVDLHVWDRHFAFDSENRDYVRAKQLMKGTHIGGPHSPKFIPPRDRIMRLPIQAKQIVLTADVTSGTIRAIDEFLASLESPFLIKSTKNMPQKGYRALGGRSSRYWYDLIEQ